MNKEKNFIGLTPLQERILILLAEGNSPEEIATLLNYSLEYIRVCIKKARMTLDAKTTIQAVCFLVRDLIKHGNY